MTIALPKTVDELLNGSWIFKTSDFVERWNRESREDPRPTPLLVDFHEAVRWLLDWEFTIIEHSPDDPCKLPNAAGMPAGFYWQFLPETLEEWTLDGRTDRFVRVPPEEIMWVRPDGTKQPLRGAKDPTRGTLREGDRGKCAGGVIGPVLSCLLDAENYKSEGAEICNVANFRDLV